jgi:hypothetical protein
MFFTLLSASAGMWLVFTPVLWPGDPARAILAASAGLFAIAAAPLGVGMPRARLGVALAGLTLLVANFVLAGEFDATVNFVVAGLALFAGGLAPRSRLVSAPNVLVLAAPAPQAARPRAVEAPAVAA